MERWLFGRTGKRDRDFCDRKENFRARHSDRYRPTDRRSAACGDLPGSHMNSQEELDPFTRQNILLSARPR
jgi:hypothetical protein